jgi:hypothetical protein
MGNAHLYLASQEGTSEENTLGHLSCGHLKTLTERELGGLGAGTGDASSGALESWEGELRSEILSG